jgi:hypothetical protein
LNSIKKEFPTDRLSPADILSVGLNLSVGVFVSGILLMLVNNVVIEASF